MEEKKLNVIPTQADIDAANQTGSEIADQYEQEIVSGEVSQYSTQVAENLKQKTEN